MRHRVAIATRSRRRIGGVEQYLSVVIPELSSAGHDVALFYEHDRPLERELIAVPDALPSWSVQELGTRQAIDRLKAWQPTLIYAHGQDNPELEAALLPLAPVVFFAHAYQGTCVSGAKTFKWPTIRPCDCRFGWPCLLRYFPRRCGGLNPITMVTEFDRHSRRLRTMRGCAAVITHSDHIRRELARHGLTADRTFCVPYCGRETHFDAPARGEDKGVNLLTPAPGRAWQLAFIGRMDRLKGGRELLQALPHVARSLNRPIHLTLAGDGPERAAWEGTALSVRSDLVDVTFRGWLEHDDIDQLLDGSHLLVVPSLWPEPFGLVGLEARRHGLPVAAFSVGGVGEWLADGVNGRLASGDPPRVEGLAAAIVECLADPIRYAAMRRAARERSDRFTMRDHIDSLTTVFNRVAGIPLSSGGVSVGEPC